MMKNYRSHALVALSSSVLLLSGCSHLPFGHHEDNRYKTAKPGASLEVPPDLTKPAIDNRFSVPDANSDTTRSAYEINDRASRKEAAEDNTPAGAKLSPENNNITLAAGTDRAWRLVGLALDRAGFTVDDRNREKGVYFVSYVDPKAKDEDTGMLSKLEFWKDKAPPKPQKYRILVTQQGSGSVVTILDKDGFTEHTETSSKILKLIFNQLK